MAERDTRAPATPMPEAAANIGQQLIERLKPMLDAAFDEIAALPGNAAERQNDALSAIATAGAFVGLQLSARLMQLKGVDALLAMAVAIQDIEDRAHVEIGKLVLRGARG